MSPVGNVLEMVVLLVDDRDGRVVAEVETEEEARRVLDGWAGDDGGIPDYLCLVELGSYQGTVFGFDTSMKIRPLR